MIAWLPEELQRALLRSIALSCAIGLPYDVLIIVASRAVDRAGNGLPTDGLFLWAVVLLIIALCCAVPARGHLFRAGHGIIDHFQSRVIARLSELPLASVEQLDTDRLTAVLGHAPRTVGDGLGLLSRTASYLTLQLVLVIYMAWLDPGLAALFLLTLAMVYAPVLWLFGRLRQLEVEQQDARGSLAGALDDLVEGFAAVRLHGPRRRALLAEIVARAERARTAGRQTGTLSAMGWVVVDLAALTMAGIVIVVIAAVHPEHRALVLAAGVMIFYMPVAFLAQLPLMTQTLGAFLELRDLLATLDAAGGQARAGQVAGDPPAEAAAQASGRRLTTGIAVEGLSFHYPPTASADGFAVGPISFTVPAGTICFLTGGNGSGKSTVLKLITGLYRPDSGAVCIDGRPLTPLTDSGLFSGVFTDSYLFQRLYGYQQAEPARVAALLAAVEMTAKTRLEDGAFSTVALSTGQRKRLSLVVALLEDRPVLVLDEWAAEQDPAFRRWFYGVFLPGQRATGRTIIAATHDDRFFSTADQVLVLDRGRVVSTSVS